MEKTIILPLNEVKWNDAVQNKISLPLTTGNYGSPTLFKLKCNPVYCFYIYMSPRSLVDNMKMEMQSANLNFHILVCLFHDHIKMERLFDV